MLVRLSTYMRVKRELEAKRDECNHLIDEYNLLADKWNSMARRVRKYGLPGPKPPSQFTDEEIQKLIRLTHPDRHGGSATANEMTRRLLEMRKKGKR